MSLCHCTVLPRAATPKTNCRMPAADRCTTRQLLQHLPVRAQRHLVPVFQWRWLLTDITQRWLKLAHWNICCCFSIRQKKKLENDNHLDLLLLCWRVWQEWTRWSCLIYWTQASVSSFYKPKMKCVCITCSVLVTCRYTCSVVACHVKEALRFLQKRDGTDRK